MRVLKEILIPSYYQYNLWDTYLYVILCKYILYMNYMCIPTLYTVYKYISKLYG